MTDDRHAGPTSDFFLAEKCLPKSLWSNFYGFPVKWVWWKFGGDLVSKTLYSPFAVSNIEPVCSTSEINWFSRLLYPFAFLILVVCVLPATLRLCFAWDSIVIFKETVKTFNSIAYHLESVRCWHSGGMPRISLVLDKHYEFSCHLIIFIVTNIYFHLKKIVHLFWFHFYVIFVFSFD